MSSLLSRKTAVCLVGIGLSSLASSATIRMLDVNKHSGRYELVARTHMSASAEAIFDVLVDYDHLYRISSVYKETRYLAPDIDGTPMVYTRMAGCMMFYCMNMRRVERLEAEPPFYIRTDTLPEQSDFTYAHSEWRLEPELDGTAVSYTLVLEPDFWVPPVIGPWFLKRTLKRGGSRVIDRIERLANGLPARVDADD